MSLYKRYSEADVEALVREIVGHLRSMSRSRDVERLHLHSHRDANFDFFDRIGQPSMRPGEGWRIDIRFDPYAVARYLLDRYNLKPQGGGGPTTPFEEYDDEDELDDRPAIISLPPEREE